MIKDKIYYILVTETLSLVPLRPSRLIKMLRWTRAISFTLYIFSGTASPEERDEGFVIDLSRVYGT